MPVLGNSFLVNLLTNNTDDFLINSTSRNVKFGGCNLDKSAAISMSVLVNSSLVNLLTEQFGEETVSVGSYNWISNTLIKLLIKKSNYFHN